MSIEHEDAAGNSNASRRIVVRLPYSCHWFADLRSRRTVGDSLDMPTDSIKIELRNSMVHGKNAVQMSRRGGTFS
ncbi:MAG: hypothetical protein PHE53_11180 [Thermoguttaceae bacterium]|nr:hypothetical protein [Thermoguttaceae bacterium]